MDRKDSSTSTMKKHIASHEKKDAKLQSQHVKPIDSYFSLSKVRSSSVGVGIDKEELHTLLLNATVACNWPFDQFDNPHFRMIIQRAFPGHVCPGRMKIVSLLKIAANTARDEIKHNLTSNTSRISLALDCWTSPSRWEFMSMSHFNCSMINGLI